MRKLFLFLVLGMFVPAFVFSGGRSAAGSGGSINFWMQNHASNPVDQQNMMDRAVAQFKKDTGITVNVTYVDWAQTGTKYTLAASGGEAPDVAETFQVPSWVRIGGDKYGPMIIDDVVAELGESGFPSAFRADCFVNGHWYALPWRSDVRFAAYNQQIFDAAGIKEFPKTYAELIELGKRLTTYNADGSIDRSGFTFAHTNNAYFDDQWYGLLAGHGGSMMDDTLSRWTLDTDQNREALKFMQDAVYTHRIIPDHVIDPSYEGTSLFMAGKAAILLGASPVLNGMVKENAPQLVPYLRGAVMPSKTGSGPSSIMYCGVITIYKTTKNPAAAKAWLKYFLSKDVMLDAMKAMGLTSSWTAVMNDPHFQNDPWYKTNAQQAPRANAGNLPVPEMSELEGYDGALNIMCRQVMAGGNIQAAINECVAKVNAILKR